MKCNPFLPYLQPGYEECGQRHPGLDHEDGVVGEVFLQAHARVRLQVNTTQDSRQKDGTTVVLVAACQFSKFNVHAVCRAN